MDQDLDGDGAINLSTSQRPSAATTPNEGVQTEDIEQVITIHSIDSYQLANILEVHELNAYILVLHFSRTRTRQKLRVQET